MEYSIASLTIRGRLPTGLQQTCELRYTFLEKYRLKEQHRGSTEDDDSESTLI